MRLIVGKNNIENHLKNKRYLFADKMVKTNFWYKNEMHPALIIFEDGDFSDILLPDGQIMHG